MNDDTLTAEEKIVYYYFYILNKIKEELILKDNKDGMLEYNFFLYPALNDPHKPTSTEERRIIEKLIKDGVVEQTDDIGSFKVGEGEIIDAKSAGYIYYLKIINPVFNDLYEKYNKIIKSYCVSNVLTFFPSNGIMVYVSPKGEEYKGKIGINTNSYTLLNILTKQPHKIFSFDDLAIDFKESIKGADSSSERRVRDAVGYIKEKLKYRGEDLFVSDYGFGLNCDVNLR